VTGRRRRLGALALAEIGVLFAVTRAVRYDGFPWFGDEGWYATYAVRMADGADPFLSLLIGKEPLPYWMAAGLIDLGVGPMEAMRLVSLAGAALALAMVGLLGRRLGGAPAGLAAAALYALLPLFVVHDAMGLPDPLLTGLMAAALLLSLRLAERVDVPSAIGLGVVLAALVLTKESGKVAFALAPLAVALVEPERRRRWAALLAGALALGGAAWLALRLSTYNDDVTAYRDELFRYPVRSLGDALTDPVEAVRGNWRGYARGLVPYLTVPVIAAALAGTVLLVRERRRLALVVLAWAAVPLVAALLLPLQPFPRYVVFAMPPVVACAGLALARAAGAAFARLGATPAAATAVAAGTLLLLAPALVRDARFVADPAAARYPGLDDAQYVTGISAGAPWPRVARELRRRAGGREATVMRMQATTWVLEFLLEGERLRFVDSASPRARGTRFVVQDVFPFPDPAGFAILRDPALREVAAFPRPRGGGVVRIYERAG
jgi:4-amino-4-deoxy-L-arabinose transferase-like glycosyltransferase